MDWYIFCKVVLMGKVWLFLMQVYLLMISVVFVVGFIIIDEWYCDLVVYFLVFYIFVDSFNYIGQFVIGNMRQFNIVVVFYLFMLVVMIDICGFDFKYDIMCFWCWIGNGSDFWGFLEFFKQDGFYW